MAPRSAGDVLPEFRLGDDDLLDHRRRRHALRYCTRRAIASCAAQLETQLVEAQLQTLQRQMQPHFLFNTLNTISALMHRDVDAADDMIARLSDLLRMSLQNVGVQEVPLKEELDFLSKYLEIEQTRFRDRLTVVFDVQAETLDALVPNLLLQPLVENAIKHGIGPRPTPGQIEIRAGEPAACSSSTSRTTASGCRPRG